MKVALHWGRRFSNPGRNEWRLVWHDYGKPHWRVSVDPINKPPKMWLNKRGMSSESTLLLLATKESQMNNLNVGRGTSPVALGPKMSSIIWIHRLILQLVTILPITSSKLVKPQLDALRRFRADSLKKKLKSPLSRGVLTVNTRAERVPIAGTTLIVVWHNGRSLRTGQLLWWRGCRWSHLRKWTSDRPSP